MYEKSAANDGVCFRILYGDELRLSLSGNLLLEMCPDRGLGERAKRFGFYPIIPIVEGWGLSHVGQLYMNFMNKKRQVSFKAEYYRGFQ